MNLLEKQLEARKQGKKYALATVVKTQGSTPRAAGVKMMVYEDGSTAGTVGGGYIENAVIQDALLCIKDRSCALKEYKNSGGLGPACGGLATVYIDVDDTQPLLVICGLGHVGAAVAKTASMIHWEVCAVDTRQQAEVEESLPYVDRFHHVEDFRQGIADLQLPPGAFFLISTYSHETDAEALAAALATSPAYAGMMGSHGKIKAVKGKLSGYGFTQEQLSSVYMPIGLDVGGSTPAEISVSIMAEIQMVRYAGTGKPLKAL